ncbi:uncharacterized protein F5147DRAFT_773329 [Suillus discolor]|uniref:Uncharacterized protein n=1 Tax=Suillus discolor TaxID=1912936 RepID=A0A9P7F7I8_9AGAM|nr:uncharacterized protein F5147DRAFT_773329 [Suillus discolor]KAG2108994.1 hypothetical protein F5147DRAFT_773329 [Suillus discolor]
MADSQAWQAQFGHQPWFDPQTSTHGLQLQSQPDLDLITVPGNGDSDPQTDQGLYHVNYSMPQSQTLTRGSRGHPGFNSEASMSQPESTQPEGQNSGLIILSLPQWQPMVPAQFGGLNPRPVPQLVPAQLEVSLNLGRFPPLLPQWHPQFEGPSSGIIPPSLPQWQAPVPQSAPVQYGSSSLGLPPSQPQLQAPPSFDSQHFHPCFSLSDTHSSEPPITTFQANITENLGHVRSIRTSHKRDSQWFTAFGDTKHAHPTGTHGASKMEPVTIAPDVLKNKKKLAHSSMMQRVFEMGLFPTPDEITTTVNAALDTAIGSDVGLNAWKMTHEGQLFIGRLKGIVKNIHSDFQKAVPTVVLASNQSLAELLMTNADMQASQNARFGNLVENTSSFDVNIRWPVEDGHVESVHAPLAHSSVTALLEYMLVTKKYLDYLRTNTGNWKTHFGHAFTFSAAICCLELEKLSHAGWENAVANDFPINRVKAVYDQYVDYISSLVGDRKSIFDQMLSGMYRKA